MSLHDGNPGSNGSHPRAEEPATSLVTGEEHQKPRNAPTQPCTASIFGSRTRQRYALAIDTEFRGAATVSIQAATRLDHQTLAIQVYRHPDVPAPPDGFDPASSVDAAPEKYGRVGVERVVFRPVKLIDESLSPARMLRDLLVEGAKEWPPILSYGDGLARGTQAKPRSEKSTVSWGEERAPQRLPGIEIELIGHFLRADLGRLGKAWYESLQTETDRRDRVVLTEQRRLAFRRGRSKQAPPVEWLDAGASLYDVTLSTLDIRLPFLKGSLNDLSTMFLGLGKPTDLTAADKSDMFRVFREQTTVAYRYAMTDVVNTLLIAEQMRLRDREIYSKFGIPEKLIPAMKGTLGSRVSTFLMRATKATVATGTNHLSSLRSVERLSRSGGVGQFAATSNASRFGVQTGGTHGGLLFSRSPTRLAHEGPELLRDVDLSGCYTQISAGINVYMGRPVIVEPGDIPMTLTEAVKYASRVAPADGWLVRVSGSLKGFSNVLVPSTENAITTANYRSIRRSGARRKAQQAAISQDGRNNPASHQQNGSKLYTGVIESGIITRSTWEVIQVLPDSIRHQYETLLVDSLILYPTRLIADDGKEYDRLYEQYTTKGAGWEQELNLDQLTLCSKDRIGEEYITLRFPLGDYTHRFGEFRQEAKRKHGDKSSDQLAWKLHANTTYGVLASKHLATNNFVAANQITAQARAEAFLMMLSLNGIQVITDGCTYRVDQIPATTFAECLRLQPDYSTRRAEAGSPIPFNKHSTVPTDDGGFTKWYRAHAKRFFGVKGPQLDRLLRTHDLEHKTIEGKPAFDLLLCDGSGNYAKGLNDATGTPVVKDSAMRSYSREAKETLLNWMLPTYRSGVINTLPPATRDRELLSLKRAAQSAKDALRTGTPAVRLPLGYMAGKIQNYRAIKSSAFLFCNPCQRAKLLKQLQKFENEYGCGLELVAMRRGYGERKAGNLTNLLESIYGMIQHGESNLNRKLNLSKLPTELLVQARERRNEIDKCKSTAREALLDEISPEQGDNLTGYMITSEILHEMLSA